MPVVGNRLQLGPQPVQLVLHRLDAHRIEPHASKLALVVLSCVCQVGLQCRFNCPCLGIQLVDLALRLGLQDLSLELVPGVDRITLILDAFADSLFFLAKGCENRLQINKVLPSLGLCSAALGLHKAVEASFVFERRFKGRLRQTKACCRPAMVGTGLFQLQSGFFRAVCRFVHRRVDVYQLDFCRFKLVAYRIHREPLRQG